MKNQIKHGLNFRKDTISELNTDTMRGVNSGGHSTLLIGGPLSQILIIIAMTTVTWE